MLIFPSFTTIIRPLKARNGILFRGSLSKARNGILFRRSLSRSPYSSMPKIVAMAKGTSNETEDDDGGIAEKVAVAAGLISTPVIGWSLYTLKTTGCGLPPGPGGSIGALEGVSYLVLLGIVGWSLYTKAKTGSGLPNGPFGLLGAVEGLSYLCLLAIILVFGLQFVDASTTPIFSPNTQNYQRGCVGASDSQHPYYYTGLIPFHYLLQH